MIRLPGLKAPLLSDVLPLMQSNITTVLSQCAESDPVCDVDSLYSSLNNKVRSLLADESDGGHAFF